VKVFVSEREGNVTSECGEGVDVGVVESADLGPHLRARYIAITTTSRRIEKRKNHITRHRREKKIEFLLTISFFFCFALLCQSVHLPILLGDSVRERDSRGSRTPIVSVAFLPDGVFALQFDPWFNYRATQHLVKDGLYDFLNWFDGKCCYRSERIAFLTSTIHFFSRKIVRGILSVVSSVARSIRV
jgi:hypothetical protein